MFRAILTLAAIAGATTAVRADATADEWKQLSGTWKVAAATFNGDDATDLFKQAVLTIEKGKYTVDFGGMTDAGTLTVEPGKKPKQMRITGVEGPNKDKTMPAIYEINGDTLKVCYTIDGKEPPKEFKSTAENKTLLVTYQREKK